MLGPFVVRWWLSQIIPFVVIGLVLSLYLLGRLLKCFKLRRQEDHHRWSRYVSYILQILNFFYFSIAAKALAVFDCQYNGLEYRMSSEPSVKCDLTYEPYLQLFYPAVAYSIVYLVGIPLLLFFLLYKNKREITAYQSHRKSVSTRNLLSSPNGNEMEETDVFIRYGFLYDHYTPQV